MKKLFSLIVVFLHVLLIAKPFIPFIEYSLFKDYIAEFLCINKQKPQMHCDGKCYLNEQLKKANDVDPPAKEAAKLQMEKEWFSILTDSEEIICRTGNKQKFVSYKSPVITQFYCDIPTPPPKYSYQ
jgi:hypothetical protein